MWSMRYALDQRHGVGVSHVARRPQVEIETIDGFQGRQKDVVILSCVRASSGASSSVGFVADMRRMNVAITRAKRALWVLGNLATLQANDTWAAMIRCGLGGGNAAVQQLRVHTGTHRGAGWWCSMHTPGSCFQVSCRAPPCPRDGDDV